MHSWFAKKRTSNLKVWRASLVLVLVASAIGLIAYGGLGIFDKYHVTHEPSSQVTAAVVTHSSEKPSETKPKSCATDSKEDKYPVRIILPSIGASGCIETVGVDPKNAISAPDNIYVAGWYIKSKPPGETGLSIIDGHISGRYKVDGIFEHLSKLKTNDKFTVTLASGKVLNYSVVNVESVPLERTIPVLMSQEADITSQLNLITCGGRYDKATKLYDHRIITRSKLISSS